MSGYPMAPHAYCVREAYAAVEELMAESSGGVSLSQIKAHMKLAHGSTQRRVDSLLKGGYLINKELGGKGYAACYVIGDPLPANTKVLPTVDEINTPTQNAGLVDQLSVYKVEPVHQSTDPEDTMCENENHTHFSNLWTSGV